MTALMRISLLQRAPRRRQLSLPKGAEIMLNRRYSARGFSHIIRMARMFWQVTGSKL